MFSYGDFGKVAQHKNIKPIHAINTQAIIKMYAHLPFLYSRGQSSKRMRGFTMWRRIFGCVTSLLNITPSSTWIHGHNEIQGVDWRMFSSYLKQMRTRTSINVENIEIRKDLNVYISILAQKYQPCILTVRRRESFRSSRSASHRPVLYSWV